MLALGIPITSLPLSRIPSIATSLKHPFLFLFAPLCHPAMALVAPIRRQLGHPTIFNVLGPLLNPARPDYMVVGVHSRYLGLPFAEALRSLNVKRAWVVNGDEGLDEISPEGTTHVSAGGYDLCSGGCSCYIAKTASSCLSPAFSAHSCLPFPFTHLLLHHRLTVYRSGSCATEPSHRE